MVSGKTDLKQKILRLEQGLPQRWIYIERKVLNPLSSYKIEGVKANIKYQNKGLSYIFHQDILNVKNTSIAKIQPIVGPNGVGKTTQLRFQVTDYLEEIEPEFSISLFFDFKQMAETVEEFWAIFGERLIDQIKEKNYLSKITKNISSINKKSLFIKTFKNKKLTNVLSKLSSSDPYEQDEALEYFYTAELKSKDISDLFYGFLKLAFENNYVVVILFDEIQYLDEIDPSNVLVKMFLEKFIRLIFERHANNKLYIVISCLQNPDKEEWTQLKNRSKNFQSIVQGKEIVLGNLTMKEREEIVNQVSKKIGFQGNDKKIFLSKVKSSLDYYLPRTQLKCIANVLDMMDYTAYSQYEIRKIYENDARDYITPKLKELGFPYIKHDVKKIGGYNVDIFAEASTDRTKYIPKAFGEVSMIRRSGISGKVEKFANWLNRMRGREFKPEKDDIAFLICPPNIITPNAKKTLENNNIMLYEYSSSNVNELLKISPQEYTEKALKPMERETEIAIEPVFRKEFKYKLMDVPGIGPAKAKALIQGGIRTLKELITCNAKMKAGEIKGVGVVSLNKWKQAARQILIV